MEIYDLKDIEEKLGIPRVRMREWMKLGFIRASVEEKRGTKTIKRYSTADAYGIALFKYLIEEVKHPRDRAGEFVNVWSDEVEGKDPKFFICAMFIRSKEGINLTRVFSDYESIEVRGRKSDSDWKAITMINMGQIIAEVDALLM